MYLCIIDDVHTSKDDGKTRRREEGMYLCMYHTEYTQVRNEILLDTKMKQILKSHTHTQYIADPVFFFSLPVVRRSDGILFSPSSRLS